jgi:hypothetical protein
MLVFQSFSALVALGLLYGVLVTAEWAMVSDWAPSLGAAADSRWLWAFGVLGVVALAGPLAVGFKEFSPRKTVV